MAPRTPDLAAALAAAFLAGTWNENALVRRGAEALEPRPRWLRAVARETLVLYRQPPLDRPRELARVIGVLIERHPHSSVDRIARHHLVATRTFLTRAGRQRVTGIVVNERLNVPRADYDALRALLHNAAEHGPDSQNHDGVEDFAAHLLGRIAWVAALHPARGAKLRARFDAIQWDGPA